jgi:hypothetical protein
MFIIFGVGNKKEEEKQSRKAEHCFHCNNTSHWLAAKSCDHVSLFFIPVIPYKTTYSFRCPICNQGRKITKDEYYSI